MAYKSAPAAITETQIIKLSKRVHRASERGLIRCDSEFTDSIFCMSIESMIVFSLKR